MSACTCGHGLDEHSSFDWSYCTADVKGAPAGWCPCQQFQRPDCNGMCLMGNEVMPSAGHYDQAAVAHPECERHAA